MEGSTTFKAPVAQKPSTPLPKGKEPMVHENVDVDVPIALHEEVKGKPYSAEYFELGEIWADHGSLESDLKAIDSYYRERVASGNLKDGVETFKSLIRDAEKVTDTKNANPNLKVAKIAEYMRFMERMDKIDQERSRWQ